ncbi:hypothetical protein [Candidatus Thioglobus sp.]|uniref:hypothetical protein n=1 Tax=Candidatus Thioglobus sp. TaxID=2026721 RepID=UPI003D0D3E39
MAKLAIWTALYPIFAHIGVQTSRIYLPIIYLMVLLLFFIYFSAFKSWAIKGVLATLVVSSAFLVMTFDKGHVLIQLIPMLVLLSLIFIFFKSLVFSSTPIITKFAICVDNKPLNTVKKKYTRNVTIVWLVGFLYMFFQTIFASLWLSFETWSWVSNTGNYVLIALIMSGEFTYRNMKFKNDKISFKTFIMRLSNCRLK